MEEIHVASWTEPRERLFENSWNQELGLHRSNYAYRGRGDAADDLSTKLAQLGGDTSTLERNDELGRRILLPAELKWEVRDKLNQTNVSERVLFPALDGLTRWLVRYHAPRGRVHR
jgi:hypothetical protein